ncbi:MAG TPA: alpha/beta fold hydrolase [Lapillicoccus sp.]|nr:alpha/beta fold hydrolase [Lapillicoccus sp.]
MRHGGRVGRALRTTAFVAAGVVLLLMTAAMLFVPAASPRRLVAGTLEAIDKSFYAVPANTPAGPPGSLVRSQALRSAPAGSRAWRVLYHSTDLAGRDTVLSGVVVAPTSSPPAAGRTVVGWGHPTTGAAASCAPSNGIDPYLLIEGLPALLSAGYVVVAPDYPGLGVAGPSSYLIGTSEARSLLDAVRVARQLPTGGSTQTVLWGHSQGGHAVLFAAEQAASYAPELAVRAAAVAAPAADLAQLLDADIGDVSGVTIGSYAFAAYQQAYATQYPGLGLTSILTDAGAAVTPAMAQLCLFGDNLKLHTIARPLIGGYLRSDPASTPPWASLLAENTPGAPPDGLPVFVAQGGADTLVVPTATEGYVATACQGGGRMTFRLYPKDSHGTIAHSALPDVLLFLAGALAGTPPASTC